MAERNIIAWKQPLGRSECPYCLRWVLNLAIVAFRVHKWLASDDPRALHDHPYWFVVIVLRGSYWDVTESGEELMKPGTIRFRRASHRHTVRLKDGPCWTFLVSGPPLRRWGFWIGKRFLRREDYFKKNGYHQCG